MKNKFSIAMTLAVVMAMLVTSLALADNVVNDVAVNAGSDTITAGGSTTVSYAILNTNAQNSSDPQNSCNPGGSTSATLTINKPAEVTVTPPSRVYTGCDVFQAFTFTASAPGDYAISVSISDAGPGTYNVSPASFTLHVIAPPPSDNTAPIIEPIITGTPGSNGWYISDVNVSWNVSDPESTFTSTGCGSTNITSDTAGTTLTCSATSDGGTASQSVTIKRDATAPTVMVTPARSPDFNGWYNALVGFTVGGTDTMSNIASCDPGFTYSGPDSAAAFANGSCTDNAGNSGSGSYAFKYDATGPSASLVVTAGTAGTNGWYTSDVTVSTTGSDSASGVTCSANQSQTTETSGTVFNGSCTNGAGLTTNASPLTIKLDKTGPSASLAVTAGTPGTNGWYTSDVTVSTSGSDSISSPVTCSANQSQTTETSGAVFNGSCTNDAGLSTNASPLTIKLDKTGPSASLAVTAGTLGTNGWYTSDVTVSTSGSDSISGPVICSANQSQTTETSGAVFNGSCTNDAGLSTNAAPLTIKLDKTGPSASLAVTAGTLGNNGWYVSNVTVSTSGSDSISSPVNCSADQYQTSDTTGTIFNGSCTNDAGLSTNAASLTVKLDKTAPIITIITPPAGASYLLNQPVVANYSCSDATSGNATCAGPVASGSNINTAGTGSQPFTVNASDQAGNTISATNNYSVAFRICPLYDQSKSHKSGSTVPLKLQLCDFNNVNYSSASIVVHAVSLSKLDNSASSILDDSGAANSPEMDFRYDATLGGSGGGYIFNLSTKGLTTGTWKVTFTINGASNPTSYIVKFDVK